VSPRKKIVVGLGNPGRNYQNTRHNIGFLILEKGVLPHYKLKAKKRWGGDLFSEIEINGAEYHFLMPQTFMNLSGKAIRSYLNRHSIELCDLLVVSDDLDLPLGRVRLRHNGSSGGHLGLESIMQSLGSKDFSRLRVGIGRPHPEKESKDYVLESFSGDERQVLERTLVCATHVVRLWLEEGEKKARDFLSQKNDL